MALGKRERARTERLLVKTLTQACETAKGEITGFAWLTHTADPNAFAHTLEVTWVFETLADKRLAQTHAKARIFELTGIALAEANIEVKSLEHTVRFDSEEQCLSSHGGDWHARLAR